MTGDDLDELTRAHQLFAGPTRTATTKTATAHYDGLLQRTAGLHTGGGHDQYRLAVAEGRQALQSAGQTDAATAGIITAAHHDHDTARQQTKQIIDEARADAVTRPNTALAQRELMRRRAARLRAQRGHVFSAHQRAQRHRRALRALHYRVSGRHGNGLAGIRLPPPNSRSGIAVRAALSRLGRPYVWGATGPDRFDCSGLTQWAYAQAGLHLDRTTYQQIEQGIPVPHGHARPGDLVFPNSGHVQLAIGDNRVVEAPHAGAAVQISPLSSNVVIRRPW